MHGKKRIFVAILALLICFMPVMSAQAAPAVPVIESYKAEYKIGELVILSWKEVAGSAYYALSISGAEAVETVTDSFGYVTKRLPVGEYTAKLCAIASDGQQSAYSAAVKFTVKEDGLVKTASSAASSASITTIIEDSQTPLAPAVSQSFIWPVKEYENDPSASYAVTALDIYYDGGKHGSQQNALDINHGGMTARYETREIVAAADGIVIDAYLCGHSGISCPTRSCVGNYIKIMHTLKDAVTGVATSYITAYVHLDPKTLTVKTGDTVKQGDVIARMGSTGNSSGIHLHFAIRDENNRDLPTLEFFMNDEYMPKLSFMYFKQSTKGTVVATNGVKTRYSDWITQNYVYSQSNGWTYAK